jgi:hypothetical protein
MSTGCLLANSVCRSGFPTWDRSAQVEHQPAGAGMQNKPHLVCERRSPTGAIGRQLRLVLFDEVLGLPTGAQ